MDTEIPRRIGDAGTSTACRSLVAMLATHLLLAGCAGAHGAASRADFERTPPSVGRDGAESRAELAGDGRLQSYVAFALANSPELEASFERWKAAAQAVSASRRLPEPIVKYSYYVRSVETRVGPQQHRLSLEQWIPWPTKLSASADAASAKARALQSQFEAQALTVQEDVARAYWQLWLIEEEHRLKTEHDIVLETLAGTVRGRVSTGGASLADLNQVELGIAIHHDHHGEHLEQERVATAALIRAIGAKEPIAELPIRATPAEGLPAEPTDSLREAARQNPLIEAMGLMATARQERARAQTAERAPDLNAGLNWIVTGDAPSPIPDSGKDAVVVTAGLTLPLWGRSYRESIGSARAEAAAYRAEQEATLQAIDAALAESMAEVRDAQRRIDLYRHTLIPQAETTFRSVLGGYQTGRSDVAAALLAQQDLLELQLELARNRARHATAWAELERVVGREVEASRKGVHP